MEKLQQISEWLMRFASLNLLWIGYSLVGGLVVFGVVPATIALFKVHFDRLSSDPDERSDFRIFHEGFVQNFLKGNVLMLILLAAGIFLYADLYIVLRMDHFLMSFIFGILIALTIVYILFLLYAPAIFAYKSRTFWGLIKASFTFAMLSPVYSGSLLLAFGIILYAGYQLPVIHLFFTASIMSYLVTVVILQNMEKLQRISARG